MKRVKEAVLGVTLLAGTAGGVLWTWPSWGDSLAQDEIQGYLDARFDGAEFGGFELERHSATLRDVVLREGAIEARLALVEVSFDLAWDGHIEVQEVRVEGGTVSGSPSELQTVTKAEAPDSSESKRRISTKNASIQVNEIAVDLQHEGVQIQGAFQARNLPDGFEVHLVNGNVKRGDRSATIQDASCVVRSDSVFPLTVNLHGLAAHVTPQIFVSAVDGTTTISDRDASTVSFDLKGIGNDGSAAWSVTGNLDRASKDGAVTLDVAGVEAGRLPGFLDALPFKLEPSSRLSAKSDVVWKGEEIQIRGTLGLDNASVEHPMIATTPVHDISFSAEVDLLVTPSARRIDIKHAHVRRGELMISVTGALSRSENLDEQLYQLEAKMAETPCQTILDAMPDELVPGLKGFKLGGNAGIDLRLNIEPARPEATVLEGDIGIDGCKILEVPEAVSNLDGPFIHQVRRKDGHVQSVYVMDGHDFTPYDSIALTMNAAVLTTEDGGFWKHDGFLRSQFEAALRRNVELGRIRRGASTITMQMVKNVLLSHERTLSRKVQELFLTWVVEKRLPKKRIMEIYLNVVEFGPGIYGVTQASQHYFGKDPSELNGKESAFLATLLPSPIRRHEQWCFEEPKPEYLRKVDRVFDLMHSRKRIDDLTWEADKDTQLVFSRTQWFGPGGCIAEGRAILNAKGVQWAESGLLAGRGQDLVEEAAAEDVDVDALLEDP